MTGNITLSYKPDHGSWTLEAYVRNFTNAVVLANAVRAKLPAQVVYDWGGGLLWIVVPPAEDAQASVVRGALAALGCGGHATLIRASAEVRARVAVFQPSSPTVLALSRRLKASYDPNNIFNRARLGHDGLGHDGLGGGL